MLGARATQPERATRRAQAADPVCSTPADSVGYELTELSLDIAGFTVSTQCATNYEGTAVATACAAHGQAYTLSGCSYRPFFCSSARECLAWLAALSLFGGIAVSWLHTRIAAKLAAKPSDKSSQSEKELAIERLFNEIDRDNSGTLDRDEIGALAEKLGKQMSDEELDEAMAAMDLDGEGDIDLEEFQAWFSQSEGGIQEAGTSTPVVLVSAAVAGASCLALLITASVEALPDVLS